MGEKNFVCTDSVVVRAPLIELCPPAVQGDGLLTCNVYFYGHIAHSDRGFGAIVCTRRQSNQVRVFARTS
eukprot:4424809-Prymnesium_polylepis.2